MSKDIILISPSTSRVERCYLREQYTFPTVGLLYLSSFLKLHGYNVSLCDLMFEDFSKASFKSYLKDLSQSPLMVGISTYTESVPEVKELSSLVKETFPETKLTLGGPHATFCFKELLQDKTIDYIVLGEAESKIIPLLESIKNNNFSLENIAGIAYRINNEKGFEIRSTIPAGFITSLDCLPLPDYPIWNQKEEYAKIFSMVSTRGCPGECIFCSSRALSGKKYRFHSAEWLFSLLYYFHHSYGFTTFVFLDDTFLANKKRAIRFCYYLNNYWPGERQPYWTCKSRVDVITENIIRLIKDSGCMSLHIGIESGDQEVLNSIEKGITLEQVYNSLKILKKYNMRVDCSFILGHHCDTLKTIEKTLILARIIESLELGKSAIGIATPFPGTRLANEADKLGIAIRIKNWAQYDLCNPIFENTQVKEHHLRKALFYHESDRHAELNPGISGSTSEEIEAISAEFTRHLKEEVI